MPKTSCTEINCDLRAVSRGYCNIHYQRNLKTGAIERAPRKRSSTPCSHSGCERVAKTRGLCNAHYQSYRNSGDLPAIRGFSPRANADGTPLECRVTFCSNPVASTGYCEPHYRQNRAGLEFTKVGEVDACPTPNCGRGKSARSRTCSKCNQFRNRYSLTWESFDALWTPESRRCQNPGCDSSTDLHLDHDHSCCPVKVGSVVSCGDCVRGWLCRECNWALGQLHEDPRRIRGLVDYLEGFRASRR